MKSRLPTTRGVSPVGKSLPRRIRSASPAFVKRRIAILLNVRHSFGARGFVASLSQLFFETLVEQSKCLLLPTIVSAPAIGLAL